jgi:hypothetical protein
MPVFFVPARAVVRMRVHRFGREAAREDAKKRMEPINFFFKDPP